MERYIVFENAVFPHSFEHSFYRFCLLRQPGLLKKLPLLWAIRFLRFFALLSQERYLALFWSFLPDVTDLDKRQEAFFKKKRKKMFLPSEGTTVLSAHPAQLIEAFCSRENLNLAAGDYDPQSKQYTLFRSPKTCIPDEAYLAYGTMSDPIVRKASSRVYLLEGRATPKKSVYLTHLVLTWVCLLLFAIGLGMCSLLYAAQAFPESSDLFLSYLDNPLILVLNLLPALVAALFFYALTGRAAAAGGLTAVFILIPTWINHYKLLFRDDPFLMEDIFIAMEAQAMTERYTIVPEQKMLLIIAAVLVGMFLLAALCRSRLRAPRLRAAMAVALAALTFWGVKHIYCSQDYYSKTQNLACINQWSSTQQFQSRGFWYPFLNSAKSAIDKAPPGYSAAEAKEILNAYSPEDIPAEKRVNVIGIMLEAYADFRKFDSLSFANDPYTYWDQIKKESYSGNLVTNIFAAGTVTTERGFLTGLATLPSFRNTTNSYAWYFRSLGYTVEGSHPSHNWFYNRQNINRNLGFEHYYFDEDTYTALNNGKPLCNDSVLFPDIVKRFEEATARGEDYFSFSVTYQGHGPYADTPAYDKEYLVNTGGWPQADNNTINNYFSVIADVNRSLLAMVDSLRKSDEPVVLILFGDHMPWMGNGNSIYHDMDLNIDVADDEGFLNYYETPYLIWANDAAKDKLGNDFVGEGRTISPCFLMNEFFALAGYTGDAYAMYTTEVASQLPVVNISGVYMDAEGNLLRSLSQEQLDLLNQFRRVQYYQRNNFTGR